MRNIQIAGETLSLPDSAVIAQAPGCTAGEFLPLAVNAMDHPLDTKPLGKLGVQGKKVAILIDDWGRPTPCAEFLPAVLERLCDAADITIVTASGMHDPMGDEDMIRKAGSEVFLRYRCVSHDAGDHSNLCYIGITPFGSPVWINRYAAEADVRIIIGRIYPHGNYGYEGGYKMIVPGVASFETILRDHSLNFSPMSDFGMLRDNPSRAEADAIGRMVGVDFALNFVVDFHSRPVAAFGGNVEAVFRAGVNYGQRRVWGAVTEKPADITILSGSVQGGERYLNNPTCSLGLAFAITKPDGIVIAASDYQMRKRRMVEGHDLDLIPPEELLRLHERRDWRLDPRRIQQVIKTIRGVFYERRVLELHSQRLYLVSRNTPAAVKERWKASGFDSITQAFAGAAQHWSNPHIVVMPDADSVIPMVTYDYEE